jgi:hypothetical protein
MSKNYFLLLQSFSRSSGGSERSGFGFFSNMFSDSDKYDDASLNLKLNDTSLGLRLTVQAVLWIQNYFLSDPDPAPNFFRVSDPDPDPTSLKVLDPDPDPTFSEFWIWIRLKCFENCFHCFLKSYFSKKMYF